MGSLARAIGQPEFSSLTRSEYEGKLEKIRTARTDRELELARREAERRKDAAERELAAVEERAG